MDQDDLIFVALIAVAAISVVIVIYLLVAPYMTGERRAEKRLQGVSDPVRKSGGKVQDAANNRKKQVAETLKDLEQNVLGAFYFRHLNQTEIARQMGISCNYVSHILRNATKKLKKILVTEELRDSGRRPALARRRTDDVSVPDPRPIVDRLTRLYKRGYFDGRLEEELSKASRECAELAVLFVRFTGMDAFQKANGTLKVDETIHGLVHVMRRSLRRHDILTRYDNETFAIILPFTGQNAAVVQQRLTEALCLWLSEHRTAKDVDVLMPGTGIAMYPFEAVHPTSLANLAHERTCAPIVVLKKAA